VQLTEALLRILEISRHQAPESLGKLLLRFRPRGGNCFSRMKLGQCLPVAHTTWSLNRNRCVDTSRDDDRCHQDGVRAPFCGLARPVRSSGESTHVTEHKLGCCTLIYHTNPLVITSISVRRGGTSDGSEAAQEISTWCIFDNTALGATTSDALTVKSHLLDNQRVTR
jgi:hypothetical protein